MTNEELITRFYQSFQNRDFKTMQQCYSDHAKFNDPVFTNLHAEQVRKMWEMLLVKATDLELDYTNIRANDFSGSAEWTARYTFSKTGKKVINRIKASFIFEKGKILNHKDEFNFYTWSKQALGTPGLLLGWTPFIKNKIRNMAMKNLIEYMNKHPE